MTNARALEPPNRKTNGSRVPSSRIHFEIGAGNKVALSAGAVALASTGTAALKYFAPDRPFSLILFFAAVAVSSGIGGVKAGMLATVMSALACDFFFLPPFHSLAVASSDAPLLLLLVLGAGVINGLSGKLRSEIRASERRFQSLNEVTAEASSSLDIDVILGTLLRWLENHSGASSGAVLLKRGDDFQTVDSWGVEASSFLADLDKHSVCRWPAAPTHVSESILASPLIGGGEVHGWVLLAGSPKWARRYGRLDFIETLCRQIGPIVQNAKLYDEVRAAQESARSMSRRLVNVQEAERRQIARELHDEIGQELTVLKLSLDLCARTANGSAVSALEEPREIVRKLMLGVSNLSLDLRPAMLDDLGLLPTLIWQIDRYSATTGVQTSLEHNGVDRRFPTEVETTAYRIIQEALTNIARHAGVDRAHVRLWSNDTKLGIRVSDEGVGFSSDAFNSATMSGGISGMKERAALVGGTLTIETGQPRGMVVLAELPVLSQRDEET